MNSIFNIRQLRKEKLEAHKKDWTAVVPMAGVGSRLGFGKPKALYPILGRSILDWMLHTLEDCCNRVILVVSESGKEEIQAEVKRLKKTELVEFAIQASPKGMADAVLQAKQNVKTPHVLVVWGDQVTIRAETLLFCEGLLEKFNASLSIPTYIKKDPYICFDRDASGKLIAVRQKREGEVHEDTGENDCGVFCFDSKSLFEVLEREKNIGKNTEEYNLLPLLPKFQKGESSVLTVRLDSEEETLGVNTVSDAETIERILSER